MTENKIREILAVNDPDKIQKFLRNIKPFQKISPDNKIPLEMLEKLVHQYCDRYDAGIQYIQANYKAYPNKNWNYCAEVSKCFPYRLLTVVYAADIYTLFAKIGIAFYLYSQNGFISHKTSHPEYGIRIPEDKKNS